MKLYDIPKGSKIKYGGQIITFDHIDGMYSLCITDVEGKYVHLSASTPLVKVGDYYEITSSTDADAVYDTDEI